MGSGLVNSYRDLDAWKEAMNLAEMCYRLTATFPREELYGMTGQIRRAAVSVPANIAEGYGRENRGEYIQFLRISQGSLKELETHLLLVMRVGLGAEETVQPLLDQCDRVGRILRALIRSLRK
ncbi:MAG: four helix bundle protein [Chloroflexus sp.]|uniref:four helix bundle protein n=1 Tax=Chloroflexus sp. TaxID=1904827 RepID=UPI00404A0E01